ncbi:pyridoxal phosphate-dependent decarboxylase family protein [Streptomyces chilikensis]|uniref:Aminotransferase class V-fold PLP-dependent enzyme n=1 Tax=Streptomyces chilikensis TaxID=1194079 RepID=A0ABV3EHX4_9ACTN
MIDAPRHKAASPGGPSSAPSGRADLLDDLCRHLTAAWESFDRPRAREPRMDADLADRLRGALPGAPGVPREALDDAVGVLEASMSPSRPLFLAYVPSTGLETGVIASALSAAYDVNLASAAGAADLLDEQAVRWVAEFVGYPAAEGHFTSGGQTSNLTALLAAREQALPGAREQGVTGRRGTVYCSAEAHHSVVRAVEAAGLGRRALRRVPVDERHRMRPDELQRALVRDRAAGFTPVAVVATAGTTLTGAVDPLAAVADVCGREEVWLHVDGAYGVSAAATRRAAHLFDGLDRADSVTVDAHKWLGLQKGCSVLLVRRRGPLRAAFGHEEHYMPHEEDTGNPVDRTFEYSRPLRSLRLWLSLRVHGADRFRTWIESTLSHAALLADEVRGHSSFSLLCEPVLSTVCFRHVVPGLDDSGLDAHNDRLVRAMQADGRVFLASAVVDGRTCLRTCFVNFRTTSDGVRTVLEVADELGMALARETFAGGGVHPRK